MLFIKKIKRTLTKLINDVKIEIEEKKIKFRSKTIRWLDVILDLRLDMRAYFNLKIKKVKNVLVRIKGIISLFGLFLNLTRRVYVVAVYSIMLYGAELWWREGERG